MLVLWKVAQRRYRMFSAVHFLLICCKRFWERVSFKGLCDILEGGKIWKQRQMKGVLGQRWNFLLSNFPLALLSSPAAWWEILSRKKQWVSTHILSATLCLSCWYLWYFYHHLLILLPLPSKSVQGSSSQIPPLLLSPNMPECIRQDLWLNWDHPWIGLKIFDKEGCRLGLTLQMQKNNRVGIHHGELNSRLVWESVNKTRPALWRILEEIADCFGSSCMRWATTPDAFPSENR